MGVGAQDRPLVVIGGHHFDVSSGSMLPNAGIVAVGGRLLSVGSDAVDLDLSAATRLKLEDDQYVLPGLIDLHAHYNGARASA